MANETSGEDKAKKAQEMMDDNLFKLDVDALETVAGGEMLPREELLKRFPQMDTGH